LKLNDKLAKVNNNFNVYLYDNGFMLEIGGQSDTDDWVTARVLCSSLDELIELITEAAAMDRD